MGGIFGDNFDGHTFSLMLSILIGFTMVWELLTEHLEHACHDTPHYMHIVEKVYRELTMLGFVSLFVVLGKEFMHLNDYEWSIPFEFAHMLSFSVSILYTLVAVVSIRRLQYTKYRWDRIATMKVNDVCLLLQANIDAEDALFGAEEAEAKHTKWPWKKMWSTLLPLSDNPWEDVEWHLLKSLFLREFKMGLEFDYSKYMRNKLLETLTMNLDIGGLTWTAVCLTLAAFVGVDMAWHGNGLSDATQEPPGIVQFIVPAVFGWGCCAVQFAVLVVLKQRVHLLLEKFGCNSASRIPRFLQELNAHIEIRNQVRFLPLFKDAGTEFLDILVERLDVGFKSPEDYLCKQGEMGDSMFFIVKGMVKVVDEDIEDEDERVLGVLKAGDFTGEMAILLSEPRSKSIVAVDNAVVCVLKASDLPELEEEFPAAVAQMRKTAMQRKMKGAWDDQSADLSDVHANEEHSQHGEHSGHGHSHASKTVFMQSAARGFKVKGPTMEHSDEVWTKKDEFIARTLIEYTLLFQCFYVAFFILHVARSVFTMTRDIPWVPGWVAVLVLILPTVLTVFVISPTSTRYFCLLVHTLKKDNDAIAKVAHSMSQVIELRNMIKSSLFRSGLQKSQDAGLPDDCTAGELAVFVFGVVDADDSGEVEYEELRTGLPEFGVFLTKPEFKILCRYVDPEQKKVLSLSQWRDFMMATDDELSTNNFRHKEVMQEIYGQLLSVLPLFAGDLPEVGTVVDTEDKKRAVVQKMFERAASDTYGACESATKVPFAALKRVLEDCGGLRHLQDEDYEHLAQQLQTSVHNDVSQTAFLDFLLEDAPMTSNPDSLDDEEVEAAAQKSLASYFSPRNLADSSVDAGKSAVKTTLKAGVKVEKAVVSGLQGTISCTIDGVKIMIDTKNFVTNPTYRDAQVPMLKNVCRNNANAIVLQTRGSKEMTKLLYSYAQGETLTDEETALVKTQLLDISKTIPALAIFSVPGGAMLLPVLAKMLPFDLMPSEFKKANSSDGDSRSSSLSRDSSPRSSSRSRDEFNDT